MATSALADPSGRKAPPGWVKALVSVYYRSFAKERGLRSLTMPLASGLDPAYLTAFMLMPLTDALDYLYGQMKASESASVDDSNKLLSRLLVRLALAQLIRSTPSRVELSLHPQRRWMQRAVDSLSQSADTASKLSSSAAVLAELLGYSSDGDARFAHAFAFSLWSSADPYPIRSIWTSRSFRHRVVDATTSVLVKRPFTDFQKVVTPLVWKELPWLWSAAYFTDRIPADLATQPASIVRVVDGQSSPFFEEAYLGWNDVPAARYRNVIDVRQLSSATNLRFDFSEATCLTTELFGQLNPGGIDVDRGHAEARQVSRGDGDWCRFEGRKRFRGNLPSDETLALLYAELTSITVPLLIEASILLGSQLAT